METVENKGIFLFSRSERAEMEAWLTEGEDAGMVGAWREAPGGRGGAARNPRPNGNGSMEKKLDQLITLISDDSDFEIRKQDSGMYALIVDDDMQGVIREDDDGRGCRMMCTVAEKIPRSVTFDEAQELFELASGPMFGLPGIGRMPIIGTVIAFHILPYWKLTEDKFVEEFNEFLQLAFDWNQKIAEMGDDDEDEEDEGDFDDDDDGGDGE